MAKTVSVVLAVCDRSVIDHNHNQSINQRSSQSQSHTPNTGRARRRHASQQHHSTEGAANPASQNDAGLGVLNVNEPQQHLACATYSLQ